MSAPAKGGPEVRRAVVVGAGLMGHGIAQVFALGGIAVTMQDRTDAILSAAVERIRRNLAAFVEAGLATPGEAEAAVARIRCTTDLAESVRQADFVTESIVEDLPTKRAIFAAIEAACPAEAILASNTSTFRITDIGAGCRRRDRLVITHYFNPPHLVPTVEVVRGEGTSEATMEAAAAVLKRLGKAPVKIQKEVPGFVVNRIQAAMMREVLALIEAGVVSAADMDRACTGSFGFRLASIGPLETADLGGLDVWAKVLGELLPLIDRSTTPPRVLLDKLQAGHLGVKSGRGFFDYAADYATGELDTKVKRRDREFLERLKRLRGKGANYEL